MSQDPQLKPPERTREWLEAEAAAIMRQRQFEAAKPAAMGPPRPAPVFIPESGNCPSHGQYAMNMLDGKGVVRWLSPECPACARQAASTRLLQRAAISPRFERCTFENYAVATPEQKAARDTCERYAADFAGHKRSGTCLILRGLPGTGKNHLATAIARQVMGDGFTALNATAFEIIRRIRDTWREGAAETEAEVTRTFADIDLLIIDEVGRQYQTKDGAESIELFNVIDARYRQMRPTIVISNQDRDGLKRYLGQATFDRLREGGAALVNFDWQSARA